jgi:hypothetical protein
MQIAETEYVMKEKRPAFGIARVSYPLDEINDEPAYAPVYFPQDDETGSLSFVVSVQRKG